MIGQTNAVSGFGSLGLVVDDCEGETFIPLEEYFLVLWLTLAVSWNRPPNFLLVDYYNRDNDSVFEVAAKANGVNYIRQCCGDGSTSAAATRWIVTIPVSIVAVVVALFLGGF